MSRAPQPPTGVRLLNTLLKPLMRAGLRAGPAVLLTVPGRASGLPRTTPVALCEGGDRRWLVANFGEVNWVRNLRAAGKGTLMRGRRSEEIKVAELAPAQAAPLLRQAVAAAPPPIRKHFKVTLDSSAEDFERAVADHPVFLILAAGDEGGGIPAMPA